MVIIAGVIIAVCNIVLSHSHYGVILNITSFFLILYLADKVKLKAQHYYFIAVVALVCLMTWLGQGDKGYNTNKAAMIILTLAAGTMLGVGMWIQNKKYEFIYKMYTLLSMALVLLFSWKLRARGVMLGSIVICITSVVVPLAAWKNKHLYRLGITSVFAVGLGFPVGYVFAWRREWFMGLGFMKKKFYSGRNTIWYKFFTAFRKEPWTGIGSDIYTKIPDLGKTEMHNGFLHLLIIYGIVVFVLVLVLWLRIFDKVRDRAGKSIVVRQNLCVVVGMMIVSIFENYAVMPVASLIYFLLLTSLFKQEENDI
jgi:hypothetical protein